MADTVAVMPRSKKEPTENVRLKQSLAKKARMAAAALGMSLPDYLSDRLEAVIERDVEEAFKKFGTHGPRRKKPESE